MTEAVAEKEEVSYLNMSDEEMSKVDPSTFMNATATEPVAEEVATESETEADETEAVEEAPTDREGADDEVKEENPVAPVAKDAPAVPEAKASETQAADVDYKAAYERLLTPFKANGRDIAVQSVDDAIALMQMGANYNKKMAALKPNLKLMKMLENNGMLTEEKISFLIDLEKKSPEAVNKLVKDSGIDPLDLNAEKAGEYQPKTYTVNDKELELDEVLNELQGTPSYARTLDIVSTKWDGASKQVIAGSPQLLKVINEHVQSGIYDTILKAVESERVFGRLSGLSDIEAYRQVGDAIQARGGFSHLGHQVQQTTPPVVVQPKAKSVDEDKLRDKKRAASITKPAGSSAPAKDFNPLAMSDEEFSKLVRSKYL